MYLLSSIWAQGLDILRRLPAMHTSFRSPHWAECEELSEAEMKPCLTKTMIKVAFLGQPRQKPTYGIHQKNSLKKDPEVSDVE